MTLKVEKDLVFTATIVHNGQEHVNAAGSFTRTEMIKKKRKKKAGFRKSDLTDGSLSLHRMKRKIKCGFEELF